MCGLPAMIGTRGADAADYARDLIFAGSGSNLPITRALAEAFMRRHSTIRIEVPASIGSKGGISAVADGTIDVGLASRPLNAVEAKLGLTVKPYARTAVILGVHPTVEESDITPDKLLAIYRGTRSRWDNQREILVLTREPGDSSLSVLEQGIPGFGDVYTDAWRARRWITLFTDQKMNRMLARTPDAIGITDIGTITAGRWDIKALKLNGVYPSAENINNHTYPLAKVLALVYIRHKLPAEARMFMDFVSSSGGRNILLSNGYIPIE